MKHTHTPGPWRLSPTEREQRQQLSAAGGVVVFAYSRRYDTDCAIFNVPTNETFGSDEVALANARLIAAAPELLEALKAARADYLARSGDRIPPAWAKVLRDLEGV